MSNAGFGLGAVDDVHIKKNRDVFSLISAHNSLITYNHVAVFCEIEIQDLVPQRSSKIPLSD
jgi:hypothetical protein